MAHALVGTEFEQLHGSQGSVLNHLPPRTQVIYQVLYDEEGLRRYRLVENEDGASAVIDFLRNELDARAFALLYKQVIGGGVRFYPGPPRIGFNYLSQPCTKAPLQCNSLG